MAAVLYERSCARHEGIAIITLHRPQSKNAFDADTYAAVTARLRDAEEDPDIVLVLITGCSDSGYFSSGADLAEAKSDLELKRREPFSERPPGVFMRAVVRFPKLLVAAVNGPAVGVGATLLPHCDFVYMSKDAWVWTPFFKLALVPEFCSSVTFPELMGRRRANELLYMGRRLTAHDALSAGLATKLVDGSPRGLSFLDSVLEDVSKRLLSVPLAAKSAFIFKAVMQQTRIPWLERALDVEFQALGARLDDGDPLQAMNSMPQSRSKL
jgi:peroxisomal 3,2-trans-enoyl-CoA isomerase